MQGQAVVLPVSRLLWEACFFSSNFEASSLPLQVRATMKSVILRLAFSRPRYQSRKRRPNPSLAVSSIFRLVFFF